MHFGTITSLSEQLRTKSVSSVEVTDYLLARIEAADGQHRSYVTVTAERARHQAKKAEAEIANGLWRGPLHGVPIALKDIIYTNFARTTGGTAIYKDFVPSHSATVTVGLRIGVPHGYATDGVDPEVVAMWNATVKVFAHLGAIVRAVDLASWRQASQQWLTLCAAEAAWAHRETHPSRKEEYGHSVAEFIERGQKLKAVDLAAASIIRLEFSARFAALFDEIDLLLIPATPFRPSTWAKLKELEREDLGEFLRFAAPTNMTGSPTVTFPAGFDSAGLPLAAQLVGADLSEHVICQAAAAFQRATDWHLRHPPEQA